MELINKIQQFASDPILSKHEQLVHGIIWAIEEGLLGVGDQLPSINVMVKEMGFARKTIVKAYEELKDRGLVESKKVKGYFISSMNTEVTLKIALLMYASQRFQEEFYKTFRNQLGKPYQIDVFFHHNNLSLFQTIMSNIQGKYGKYVVAPIDDPKIIPILKAVPPEKLLMIDRYLTMPETYSYIAQEFEQSNYEKLVALLPDIRKFNKVILFFNPKSEVSSGVVRAFTKFSKTYDINGVIEEKYTEGSLQRGTLYFCPSDTNLWEIIKDCRDFELQVGNDIGILSHDDHVVKELVGGGITTISTSFTEMAHLAANHVKDGKEVKKILPMHLIRRKSL
ncbi:GntR family transcriptional regulator [Arenibacter sp. GZD96]|uniref:GntR family transcriptional regulator n=1 Tax=Aurantibrevibacter litoralis TaxID=3106030 RepID=UPI002AFE72BC|nr:GntR family transcriptional regulator [Arenibacter sp. GZD-96]MEA1784801.1 GntR family transcriptional regulator [Arenibacter sp. GZD-96]